MVEITQYALNQRSPAEGKGKGQKLQKQHALKGQKLLAQGVWGHDDVLMPWACGVYMRNS